MKQQNITNVKDAEAEPIGAISMKRAIAMDAERLNTEDTQISNCLCTGKACERIAGPCICLHNGREYWVKGFKGCPWEKENNIKVPIRRKK
jgi:hypothetical protein